MRDSTVTRFFIALLWLGLATLMGCGERIATSCTRIGCSSGVGVRVTRASWPSADYRLTVRGGNSSFNCTFMQLDDISCTDEGGVQVDANVQSTQTVVLGEFENFPEELEITVTADGTDLLSTTVRPDYQIIQPNGPECEPTCQTATVEVTVP